MIPPPKSATLQRSVRLLPGLPGRAARPVLLEAAGRYRATVTYKLLATAVQEASGITTTQLMHQWIGDVLGLVTDSASPG